jgi:hypothetical protein
MSRLILVTEAQESSTQMSPGRFSRVPGDLGDLPSRVSLSLAGNIDAAGKVSQQSLDTGGRLYAIKLPPKP